MVIKGPSHIAINKLQQILAAAEQQLSPKEYQEMLELFQEFFRTGLTNWINTRLGELISKVNWELDISESPEWEEALIECDKMFLGKELYYKCLQRGLSPMGTRKSCVSGCIKPAMTMSSV